MKQIYLAEAKRLYFKALRTKDWKGVFNQEYLKTDHWRELKRLMTVERPMQCEICGNKYDVHLHHLQYKNWHDVKIEDLVWLCEKHLELTEKAIKEGHIAQKGDSSFLIRDMMRYLFELEINALQEDFTLITKELASVKLENNQLQEQEVQPSNPDIHAQEQTEADQSPRTQQIPIWWGVLMLLGGIVAGVVIEKYVDQRPALEDQAMITLPSIPNTLSKD